MAGWGRRAAVLGWLASDEGWQAGLLWLLGLVGLLLGLWTGFSEPLPPVCDGPPGVCMRP